MKWREVVADYLSFSHRERIAVLVLVALIVLLFVLPDLVQSVVPQKRVLRDTSWIAGLRRLEMMDSAEQENRENLGYSERPGYEEKSALSLFYFDPNDLDSSGWKRVGLRDRTITTILRFVAKGGRFREPEDLKKIYGLRSGEYDRLAPYIRIKTNKGRGFEYKDSAPQDGFVRKEYRRPIIVDINEADTTALIALPGIGSKLATRIISFRDKLGGFHSLDQLREVYGLRDSVIQKIRPFLVLSGEVRKVNINSASAEEMGRHPYIKLNIAKTIVEFRNQHGKFNSVEELRQVRSVSDSIFQKLKPYVLVVP